MFHYDNDTPSFRLPLKQALLVLSIALTFSSPAISLVGTQIATNEWSYDLTFDPFDNYSICQPNTTITLAGLGHVIAVLPPTHTDAPGTFFDQVNTNWIPEVLAGGLGARWTHIGGGTGNFGSQRFVYGFRVIADAGTNGQVFLATSGVAVDAACVSANNRDITTTVIGPASTNAPQFGLSIDLLQTPDSLALTVIGPVSTPARLQATDQLSPPVHWVDLYSFTLSTPVTNIVDLTATNYTTRFYRVASP